MLAGIVAAWLLFVTVGVLIWAQACATPAAVTSRSPAYVRFTIPTPVRDSLARAWDIRSPYQTEHAYCLAYARDTLPHHGEAFTVIGFVSGVVYDETPESIIFACPQHTLQLHTHPPTTCAGFGRDGPDGVMNCEVGGVGAYLCFPSGPDQRALEGSAEDIAFLQCDQYAIVPYLRRGRG